MTKSKNKPTAHQIFKIIKNVLYGIAIAFLLVMAAGVIASALNIPGGIKLFTVESGSMEPAIKTGSLIVIRPTNEYQEQDIITFKAEKDRNVSNPRYTTTHRIIDVEQNDQGTFFTTKGDANDTPDPTRVVSDLVLGKKIFGLPYLGYPVSIAKTRDGLIFLIIVPATLIIYSELINIKNEVVKIIKEKKEKESKSSIKEKSKKKNVKSYIKNRKKVCLKKVKNMKKNINTWYQDSKKSFIKIGEQIKSRALKFFCLILAMTAFEIIDTGAYFNEREVAGANSFTAGYWEREAEIRPAENNEEDGGDNSPQLNTQAMFAPFVSQQVTPTDSPEQPEASNSAEANSEEQTATPSPTLEPENGEEDGSEEEESGDQAPSPTPEEESPESQEPTGSESSTETTEPTPEPTAESSETEE